MRFEQRIVDAGGDRAVERHAVHEVEKGALHVGHVAVAVHVLAIEIGDDGEDGRELEKGAVALVGLGNQILRGAETGVRAERVDAAADDDGGIEAAGREHAGHHRGGGGLAVHAGDGDAVLEPHEFGQHLRALDDGNLARVGFDDFRIGGADRGAGDDHGGSGDVAGLVAFVDGGAQLRQAIGDRTAAQIGAGDLHAEVEQDLGDAAHADAADANEVRVLGGGEHGG